MRATTLSVSIMLALSARTQVPNGFVENRGQWPAVVTHQATGPRSTVWLERDRLRIDLFDGPAIRHAHGGSISGTNPTVKHHALLLRFIGADTHGRTEGLGVQRGAYNFFQGSDPTRWASGAHAFSGVQQHDLYPGVDLRIRNSDDHLKYDLILAAGTDPGIIGLKYDGADRVALRDGQLVITTSLGDLTERIPMAYQEHAGTRTPIPCAYMLREGVIRFKLGAYNTDLPVVIDPELMFCTYSGSTSNNFGYSAAYDDEGFLYAGSSAFGSGYPTTIGAYQTTWAGGDGPGGGGNGTDIAITKFDTTGSFLIWSTLLGGSGDDLPHSLIVDDAGELVLLGTTGSPDFPTTSGAFDDSFGGGSVYNEQSIGVGYPLGSDMVVARLSANGQELLGSTYLGGSGNDGHNNSTALKVNYADEIRGEVLLATNGDVMVVSCTRSADFPTTTSAPQPIFAGGSHDGIVVRFNPGLTSLLWGTYIGGSAEDAAFSAEFNDANELIICGGTASTDFPITPDAFSTTYNGGQADAFVARYAQDGSTVLFCTYYGSSEYDQAYFCDLDQNGNVFLFGQTLAPSTDLIFNALYNVPNSGHFIAKLGPQLDTWFMGSRFGPNNGLLRISPTAFLVDYCNKLYVSGWGSDLNSGVELSTTGMPVTADAYQTITDGNDFYLAVFEVDMSSLSYATYLGGAQSDEHVDGGTSRFDRRGRVYAAVCAGCNYSGPVGNSDLPTTPNAWSATNNSNCNLGVFKFDFDAPLVIAQPFAAGILCANAPVQFQNLSTLGVTYSWDFGDDTPSSTLIQPSHIYAQPGTYTVTLTAFNASACNASDVDSIEVTIRPEAPELEAMADITFCGPTDQVILSSNSFGTADHFVWSTNGSFSDTLNISTTDSTALLMPAVPGTYWVQGSTTGSCAAVDQVVITGSLLQADISPDALICREDIATLSLTGIDPGSTITWSSAALILTGQGTNTITASPSASTEFSVNVVSPTGCSWSASANIIVSPIFGNSVSATAEPTIVLPGTSVQLHATPTDGVSYIWSPAGLVSNPTASNPTAVVSTTTTFIVAVTDGVCTKGDTVIVVVRELNCADPDIFVPDAFTPDGDGNNDILFVRGRAIARMEFKVFDRWGELVFESTDQSDGWDGTYRGEAVDPAVFVYWLKADCVDGQSYFTKGNVTVIR